MLSRVRSTGVQRAELNENVDSENNHGGSSWRVCITSASMFTKKRSATASRMPAGRSCRKARPGIAYPSAVALGAVQRGNANNVLKLHAAFLARMNNADLGQFFQNNLWPFGGYVCQATKPQWLLKRDPRPILSMLSQTKCHS